MEQGCDWELTLCTEEKANVGKPLYDFDTWKKRSQVTIHHCWNLRDLVIVSVLYWLVWAFSHDPFKGKQTKSGIEQFSFTELSLRNSRKVQHLDQLKNWGHLIEQGSCSLTVSLFSKSPAAILTFFSFFLPFCLFLIIIAVNSILPAGFEAFELLDKEVLQNLSTLVEGRVAGVVVAAVIEDFGHVRYKLCQLHILALL